MVCELLLGWIRCGLQLPQRSQGLPLSNHVVLIALHQDFCRHGPSIVVGGHRKGIGARTEHGQQISLLAGWKRSVLAEGIP